jgi:hypothetical protein
MRSLPIHVQELCSPEFATGGTYAKGGLSGESAKDLGLYHNS